jgi:CubicO group peptidase (beta-lactamase class C family)
MMCRLTCLAAAATLALASQQSAGASQADTRLRAYANPADAGYSAARLDEARTFADGNRAAAVVALYRGRVIAAWGAVDRPLMAHSIRKTLAGALYGIAIGERRLSLSDSLAALGIDDRPALTDNEKRATFGDLIASRSGVYHRAAYADESQDLERPARESHPPGTHFFYNNWDFNVAETIYERRTGDDLYAAFERRIARAVGMEDFAISRQFEALEPSASLFPAHTMRLSARDLARFGQLYLQEGRWNGQQVVPLEWIREGWRLRSTTGERQGYGYLWWIYEPGALGDAYPTLNRVSVYLARGTGGQALFVIPGAELVVVHRGDTDNGRSVAGPAIWQLVERLAAARDGQGQPAPATMDMTPTSLASTLPPPPPVTLVPLTSAARTQVIGRYAVAPGAFARVFEHEGRLFMSVPKQGEAELFATAPLDFTILVQPGVRVVFQADAGGVVSGAEITIGRQVIKATRAPNQP